MTPSFFVIGLPRSGTTWLSRVVASQNKHLHIVHEAYKKTDFAMDAQAPFFPWKADAYMEDRDRQVQERITNRGYPVDGYGEVTPRLRYFAGAIQRFYPEARFVHLVRDPVKSVISMMNYGYYHTHGRVHRTPAPDNGEWSQVKRASWAWAFGHNRIRQTIPTFFRLEDLTTDWPTMKEFAAAIGVKCHRGTWERQRNRPANVSKRTHLEYEEWHDIPKAELHDMTDEEAAHYGYV